jgi:hypothetical protein
MCPISRPLETQKCTEHLQGNASHDQADEDYAILKSRLQNFKHSHVAIKYRIKVKSFLLRNAMESPHLDLIHATGCKHPRLRRIGSSS